MIGLLGKKIEMSQVFSPEGEVIPITKIQAGPCYIVEKRTKDKNGYNALQLGYEAVKERKLTKPLRNYFQKKNIPFLRYLKEVRTDNIDGFKIGDQLKVDIFKQGEFVDVQGNSKGKGFTGAVKRWGFSGGPGSHGSCQHRAVGSIGASSFPSRVTKGKHMSGREGMKTTTIENLEVVSVDVENNIIIVKGCIPGPKKGLIFIRKSKKHSSIHKDVSK